MCGGLMGFQSLSKCVISKYVFCNHISYTLAVFHWVEMLFVVGQCCSLCLNVVRCASLLVVELFFFVSFFLFCVERDNEAQRG
jgi:hypothetical protein